MYAIVDIAGQQFKVEKDKKVFVHRLEGEEGSEVEFDTVLLVDNDGKVTVGEPHISGALVTAKILQHGKGDKVLVFKKKRRKGYQKMNGHRQYLTQLQIENIVAEGGTKKAAAAKKATPKAETEVKEATADVPTAEKKAPAKKAAPKKEAVAAPKKETKASATKETAKKTTAKKAAPKKEAAPIKDDAAKAEAKEADKKEDKSE